MKEHAYHCTPDGLIHLSTQGATTISLEESAHIPYTPFINEGARGPAEEAVMTIIMLYDLLSHRGMYALDHETVQNLLARIDVMDEPIKEMISAMEAHQS